MKFKRSSVEVSYVQYLRLYTMGQHHSKTPKGEVKLKKVTSDHETLVPHSQQEQEESANDDKSNNSLDSTSAQQSLVHVASAIDDEENIDEINLQKVDTLAQDDIPVVNQSDQVHT